MKSFFYYLIKSVLVMVIVFTIILELSSLTILFSSDQKIVALFMILIFGLLGIFFPAKALKKIKKQKQLL